MKDISFWKLLNNNIVAFSLGSSLALIALIPQNWLSETQKFILALIITCIVITIVYTFYLHSLLTRLKEIESQVLPYRNALPKLIRVISSKRKYVLCDNYEVKINYDYLIKNDSASTISELCIPFYADCNNPIAPLHRLKINSIRLEDEEVANCQECYKSESYIVNKVNSEKKLERGQILIKFNSIGGLKSKHTCHILIECIAKDGWFDVDEGSWISVDSDFVTEHVYTEIQPPTGKILDFTKIEVFHKESHIVDNSELSRVDQPVSKGGLIEWNISNLKLGYCYLVHFKTVPKVANHN